MRAGVGQWSGALVSGLWAGSRKVSKIAKSLRLVLYIYFDGPSLRHCFSNFDFSWSVCCASVVCKLLNKIAPTSDKLSFWLFLFSCKL